MKQRTTNLAMCLLALLAPSANAWDAYNNFAPGDVYDDDTGHGVNGTMTGLPFFTPARISGSRFTSAATGQLAVIRIALHSIRGTNLLDIRLHEADVAGELGPVLASFTRSGVPSFGGLDAPETIVNSDPAVTLTAGSRYWIVVAPGDGNTEAVWNWNSLGLADRMTFSTNAGATYSYLEGRVGAMRIEVIPEPTAAALAVVGVVAAGGYRRRRRRLRRDT
jgi:MYXO-CTERM domain-containing protein